jgi:hypothetical protein
MRIAAEPITPAVSLGGRTSGRPRGGAGRSTIDAAAPAAWRCWRDPAGFVAGKQVDGSRGGASPPDALYNWGCKSAGRVPYQRREPVMKILALTVALLLAASPVAAQQRQQALGAGGQVNNSTLPNTGLICIEEMVATFCNVPVGPNSAGYGSSTAFSGSSATSGTSAAYGPSTGSGSSAGSGVTGGPSRAVLVAPLSRFAGRFRRLTNCATERTMK